MVKVAKEGKGLTAEGFEKLLAWIAKDQVAAGITLERSAGLRYEEIRRRLIRYFNSRGCSEPEVLADKTFDRVCEKVEEIVPTYSGDPKPYIYAVANHIYQESARKGPGPRIVPVPDSGPEVELRHQCFDECMSSLDQQTREMLLEYYSKDGQARIDHHKEMAGRLGIESDQLRLKMHRARKRLRKCVEECVARNETP